MKRLGVLVSKAVTSDEVIDIFDAAGIPKPRSCFVGTGIRRTKRRLRWSR